MQFSLIFTSFLCFTTWMNLVQASIGSPNGCPCVVFSNITIRHSKIENYTNQRENGCLFNAVAFRTVKGNTICSNPNDEWAKHVIRQLEKRCNEKISTRGRPPQSTKTSAQSTSTSPPWSEPPSTTRPASLLGSEPTSDLTSAPSTKTSTSSTAPSSISSTTLTSVSTQSTPNPTSASTSLPNTTSSTSGTTSANNRIPATSMKTRKASTRRRHRIKKRPKKRNMKKWQRRCTSKSK